jgi:segregation and condensation protein A
VSAPLNFHLEHYDGPLDLLLDLIRKQEIDIYNIPIAQITAQYLDYMNRAAEMDVELSAEFIYMAATLIHIKSKMLLPRDPALAELIPGDDPRKELVDRFKSAAEMLHQKRVVEEAVWSNPQIEQFMAEEGADPGLAVTLFDLVKTFQGVLERIKSRPTYEINKEDVSVPDMIKYLHHVFEEGGRGENFPARELFERQKSRRAMICLFLAMLELVKIQAIGLVQQEGFGEIALKRLKGFESAFTSGEEVAAIDEGYN